jgi:hypothetical protein
MTDVSIRQRLWSAMLRAADLGEDWQEWPEPSKASAAAEEVRDLMHGLSREATAESIMISFYTYSMGSPRQFAGVPIYWARSPRHRDRLDITEGEPPPFGEDGVTFYLTHREGIEGNDISVCSWRQGDLVVTITVLAPNQPEAVPYAARQFAKLVDMFGPVVTVRSEDDAVEPVVRVECPETHPIKGVLLEDGMRIYLKAMDAAYDESVPEICFQSDAAAERAGYVRRGNERSRW